MSVSMMLPYGADLALALGAGGAVGAESGCGTRSLAAEAIAQCLTGPTPGPSTPPPEGCSGKRWRRSCAARMLGLTSTPFGSIALKIGAVLSRRDFAVARAAALPENRATRHSPRRQRPEGGRPCLSERAMTRSDINFAAEVAMTARTNGRIASLQDGLVAAPALIPACVRRMRHDPDAH